MAEQVLVDLFDGFTVYLTDAVPTFTATKGDLAIYINDSNQIVGIYQNNDGATEWVVYTASSVATIFNVASGIARAPILVVSPEQSGGDSDEVSFPSRPGIDGYALGALWSVCRTGAGIAGDVSVFKGTGPLIATVPCPANQGDVSRVSAFTAGLELVSSPMRFDRAAGTGTVITFALLV